MSIKAPVLDKSDPKTDRLFPYHLPTSAEWETQSDRISQGAMMGAGAGMFIKNPLFVWASLGMAVMGFVNQQPLRQKKDATSPLMTLGMAFAGLMATSTPKMMLAPTPPAAARIPTA